MNEIIKTRTGGLGSSDAKMVAKIAKNGCLSEADKQRIAIMLGLESKPEFSTEATDYGRYIEDRIFEIIKEKYPNVVSNPYYKSEELSKKYGFDIFNHIDYEIEEKDKLIWIENKATIKSKKETANIYAEQLGWHTMLLNEKAKKTGKKPVLFLSYYFVEDYNEFIPENLSMIQALENNAECRFIRGFEIISEAIKDFHYEKKEELYAECLPAPLQEKLQNIANYLKQMSETEKQIDNFKETMLGLMLNGGIKSIQNDFFKIILIGETITNTFDKKLFEKENPKMYSKYIRTSKRNPYVTIKIY